MKWSTFMTRVFFIILPVLIRSYSKTAASKIPPSASRLSDPMTDVERSDPRCPIVWFDEVTSTMDQARELLKNETHSGLNYFAVVAEHQSRGRGTRGRDWLSGSRNLFLTVVIRRNLIPLPITLLPLRVGTLVGSCVQNRIDSSKAVKLKWPNDVLIEGRKVCGVLIEMDGDHMLVGIGCNVMTSPVMDLHGAQNVRPSTSIAAHNSEWPTIRSSSSTVDIAVSHDSSIDDYVKSHTSRAILSVLQDGDYHKELAIDICDRFSQWLESQSDSPDLVLRDFERSMDFGPQRLRDEKDDRLNVVLPRKLNSDGTLQVKFAHNDTEATLVAEYLW